MKKLILFLAIVSVQFSVRAQIPSYISDYSSFSALTLEGGQTEIEFADINNDGYLDLLTVGDHGSPLINSSQHGISVFGNGTGSVGHFIRMVILAMVALLLAMLITMVS